MMKHLLYTGLRMHGLEKALQKFVELVLYIPCKGRETDRLLRLRGILRLQNWPVAQPVVPLLGFQADSPSLRTRLGKSEFMPTHASVLNTRQSNGGP